MGQFLTTVIPDCGHVIQEDQPKDMFTALDWFIKRNMIPVNYTEQVSITSLSGKKIVISQ